MNPRSQHDHKGAEVIEGLQENKTTDFYFAGLAPWGAAVRHDRVLLSHPPNFDQPHDRSASVHYAMGDYPALDVQVDTDTGHPVLCVASQAAHRPARSLVHR